VCSSDLEQAIQVSGLDRRPRSGRITESGKLQEPEALVLPIKGLNIPFADVRLQDGDSVMVEQLREPMITVVGLVNRAGNFPYPPYAEYNLMQALGFAGGLDLSAEPRYATVYRLRADGTTVSAAFNIVNVAKSADPTDALSVRLKPYDVVAVQHTPRTRVKVWWDRVFRFYLSAYVQPRDIFGEY
jgi:protein involved in polysaccharide export with SLBB domain